VHSYIVVNMSLLKPLVFGQPRLEYLKCVLNDPEFKQRAVQIHESLNLKRFEKLALKQVNDVNVPYIYSKKTRNIDKEIIGIIGAIETGFELGSIETIGLLNGELPKPEIDTKSVFFTSYKTDNDLLPEVLSMWILGGATKREIIESLDGIEKRIEDFYDIKSKKRIKGPQNYKLIYAIHRARRKGKKFSEIFMDYGLGNLQNYSGARGITSVNKFREYYRKYEPKEPRKSKLLWKLDANSGNLETDINIGIDQTK